MMNTNFREMLGMDSLCKVLAVESLKDLDLRQKKAYKNIKYCADDQWMWVNSWHDSEDKWAREHMMDAKELFNEIYRDSQTDVYGEGFHQWGSGAQAYVRDIKFCGKEFLQKVTLYYVAKLIEESFYEVDGTEKEATEIINNLKSLKSEIGI